MATALPDYVKASVPNPPENRAPWYKNTAPAYAGIFLWIAFYAQIANGTISQASIGVSLLGLLVAGVLCFALYYYAPGMLGMQTGRPLYIVGTSTFGTQGGYIMPGLLMGLLQLGWFAVATYFSADYIMKGLHSSSHTLFIVLCLVWAYGLSFVAMRGIGLVAKLANVLNWIPLIMILLVFFANYGGVAHYQPAHVDNSSGFFTMLEVVIGFFATAGAAGADFGMNNRNQSDIKWGGLIGITLSILVAGGLPLLSVAGAIGKTGTVNFDYSSAIAQVGALAPLTFFIFAIASLVPTCFCAFIASNSFATMIPKVPRMVSTLIGVTIGVLLAITGVASNLAGFFGLVGASFGPICGAIAADYLMAGRRWSGPRQGINWAGYLAWAIGFIIGIPTHIPGLPASFIKADHPAVLLSFLVGFVVYWLASKAGLRPQVISAESLTAKA